MKLRHLAVLTVYGVLLAVGGPPTQAQNNICVGLENEMARLSSLSGGRNPALAKWDRAINDQVLAIQRLERKKRRARCDGGGFLFRRADPVQCKALDKNIRAMSVKLAKLERARDKAARQPAADNGISGRIRIIRQQLRQNNCSAPQYRAASRDLFDTDNNGNPRVRYAPTNGGRIIARVSPNRNGVVDARPTRGPEGLFSRLFGGSPRHDTVYQNDWGGSFVGTYRTLCVRTCDGYYFPISFSTTQDSFSRDAAICNRACPATDARLFIHNNPGQDSKEMVSLDGQPYAELESAFRYRTEFDSDCSCQSQEQASSSGLIALTTSADNPQSEANGVPSIEIASLRPLSAPSPLRKLSHDEDPDTIANQRGDFSMQELLRSMNVTAAKTGSKVAAKTPRGEVRIVGPDYLVAQ